MRRKWLRVLVPGIALIAALALAACGSDGSSDSTSARQQFQRHRGTVAAPTEAPADAQEGGSLNVIAASDVDYIDPGAAYYQCRS